MTMFKKLVCNDNWGFYEYSDKKDPKTLVNDLLETKVNKKMKVKFPNGVLRELPLVGMPRVNGITDMGREYTVSTTEYFFKASYEGIKVLIPIEEVFVNV